MGEERYIFSATKDEEEIGRLRLQENIFDPVTVRYLETVGVAEGCCCLEIGAGTGSIAQWVSARALGADSTALWLPQRVGPQVRVLRCQKRQLTEIRWALKWAELVPLELIVS